MGMKVRPTHLLMTALAIFAVVAVASFRWSVRAAALPAPDEQRSATDDPEPDRSVLQGVYTEEQRKRGQGVYADACASCHAGRDAAWLRSSLAAFKRAKCRATLISSSDRAGE